MKYILLVEDDMIQRDALTFHLQGIDYRIESAWTVAEMWKALEVKVPNLMILDVMLPPNASEGVNVDAGIEVLPELLVRYPSLPVIVMTGRPNIDGKEIGQRYRNVVAFFHKPVSSQKLEKVIAQTIGVPKRGRWGEVKE
jgi:DNA-binding NtrC family response regulator